MFGFQPIPISSMTPINCDVGLDFSWTNNPIELGQMNWYDIVSLTPKWDTFSIDLWDYIIFPYEKAWWNLSIVSATPSTDGIVNFLGINHTLSGNGYYNYNCGGTPPGEYDIHIRAALLGCENTYDTHVTFSLECPSYTPFSPTYTTIYKSVNESFSVNAADYLIYPADTICTSPYWYHDGISAYVTSTNQGQVNFAYGISAAGTYTLISYYGNYCEGDGYLGTFVYTIIVT